MWNYPSIPRFGCELMKPPIGPVDRCNGSHVRQHPEALTSRGRDKVRQKRRFLIDKFPNEDTPFRDEFYGWPQRKKEEK